MDDPLRNKRIWKLTTPFLVIFVLSILYGLFQVIPQITRPGSAAGEIDVEIANTSSPATENNQWTWNILSFAETEIVEPIALPYNVYWCNGVDTADGSVQDCRDGAVDFTSILRTGTIPIQSRDSTSQITHASVPCGRVGMEVLHDDQKSFSEVSTGLECNGVATFGANNLDSGFSFTNDVTIFTGIFYDLINRLERIQNLSGLLDSSSDVDEVGNQNGSSDQPNPDPINPNPTIAPNPTTAPNPTRNPSPERGADAAIEFKNDLIEACGIQLISANIRSCVNNASFANQQARDAGDFFATNCIATGETYCQCVHVARGLLEAQTGYRLPGVANAKGLIGGVTGLLWIENNYDPQKSDYNKPQVGDLAVWSYEPDGHVGYVIEAAGDKFVTIDGNKNFDGRISQNNTHDVSGYKLAGWLRR